MSDSVDRYAALEANPHTAKWTAWLSGDGRAECRFSCDQYCSSYRRALLYLHSVIVDCQARHGRKNAPVDRVLAEWPTCG
jgi:hypothetical protein